MAQEILRQIAQLGHPILRKKAENVENIKDKKIKNLINDMTAVVMDADGVGLAAPQVYEPLKVFILASHKTSRYPDAPEMKPLAIINPQIISASAEKTKDWEACLSIPGIRGLVPRSNSITVEYQTKNGIKVNKKYSSFLARIFQHEYDHLEGLVFLDRLESNKDIISEKEYQKLIRREKSKRDQKSSR